MTFLRCDRCGYTVDSGANAEARTKRKITKMCFVESGDYLVPIQDKPILITRDLCSTCVREIIRIMRESPNTEAIENDA